MNTQTTTAATATAVKPVLIVGAGPTGLTAAMELSRFGIPVRLVDKRQGASETSRALAVQTRTVELLAQRGVGQQLVALGNKGHAASIYAGSKRLGQVQLSQIPSRFNYVLLISQAETERLLREKVGQQGVTIEWGTELLAFSQPASAAHPGPEASVKAVLRNQAGILEELDASYVISAEGAHSLIRRTLNLEFKGKSLPHSYALADMHIDGEIPNDELSIFLADNGFMAVFPMGNGRFRFIATDPEKHAKDAGDPTLDEIQQLYDNDTHIPARLHNMVWSSRFRINSRMLDTLRERHIFFGGDSAHIHSPAGGQGMNTGIQDMINLSWKLAFVLQSKATSSLLDTYQEDRLPVIRDVVARTETATDAFNSDSSVVHQLITHIAPLMLNTSFVQQMGTGVISETGANYRESSLSKTYHKSGSLRAGDRVPDVVVQTSDSPSQESYLYDLLDPSCFALLLTGDTAALPTDWQEQLRPWQAFLKTLRIAPTSTKGDRFTTAFGAGQGIYLVRPDAYLGLVAGQNEFPTLVSWLTKWFPPVIH